jgi:glycosyltransferase involved in cell wall biosynthesis
VRLLPELRARRLWFAFQHGDVHSDFKQRLYNQVDRLSLRAADRVVSVCQAFVPRLLTYGVKRERIRILHNAALPMPPTSDIERTQLRDELGIRNGELMILSVGRLSREKGHADLLRAMGRLRSQAWKLVLLGIGPERGALERVARSLGIGERVVFAGFHSRVADFFSIADVFVLPSHSEGSSNVLLEAMMARVPIVATRAGGNPEIVLDENTGLLVDVGDPSALAGAIMRLLRDRDLASQFADSACLRATQEFSVDRYRHRLSGLYAEALGNAHERTRYPSAYSGGAN